MAISAHTILQSLFPQFSQTTRLLQLTTPLGRDKLLAECVRGEEGLGSGFEFVISALSADAGIALKSLIGQPALLQLMTAHSRETMRPFHGHVIAVEQTGANGGFARYTLTLGPWTNFAALGRDSRVFQDMTVFDMIDAIFEEYQGKGRLAPAWRFDIADRTVYPIRSLCTQYQESNMAFVERLMGEEGLFYYFEHSGDPDSPSLGSHTMVIADHNGSFHPNAQASVRFSQSSSVMKQDGMDRWRTELHYQTNAVELGTWDYRSVNRRTVAAADAAGVGTLLARETLGAYAFETRQQGQRLADNLLQGLTARKERFIGAGTVRTLSPGTTFALHGQAQADMAADDDERSFLIVRAVHLMHNNLSADLKAEVHNCLKVAALALLIDEEQTDSLHAVGRQMGERPLYRNRIDAIRSRIPYRTCQFDAAGRLRFQRPTIRGQQSAIVVGPAGSVVHTDRDHRVKVQFHWQRGAQSHSRLEHAHADNHTGAPADDSAGTWVRVATPLAPVAGANWGSHALPRVGQEVLVDFIEGDIDRPVIIGALYNGSGAQDGQANQVSQGGGASTGNAPAWFPGEREAHAHPAVLSGIKSQAMNSSQSGAGAYSQLVMDDSPAQSRMSLQRHAGAHKGTDELNLGSLRHQTDNQRLQAAGFGAELKTEYHASMRAAKGMLLSTHARANASGSQLDAREASVQTQRALDLQTELATMAQKHNAKLVDPLGHAEPEPKNLSASQDLFAHIAALDNASQGAVSDGDRGGAGQATAFSRPLIELASPSGIVAATPASAIVVAGMTTSISAGQDVNLAAQGNSYLLGAHGISLFTYGKASVKDKPNQETGIRLHAASGKVTCQSQDSDTRITADKAVTVASVTKAVSVAAHTHLLFTAQGAMLKLEGGNIMLHAPGKVEFKASKKELAGPKDSRANVALPKGELKSCPTKA
jgi:type VI secretion system secreted protein VgrG